MSDPATLQVLQSSLRGVADEMLAGLVRSARSANIKERRDCSTAVFDPGGRMIAQAESIPVHLGAMPDAVAACLTLDPVPGDVLILNDPFTGGTHLPDITLVTLVEGLGILVSRAHHADVGGMRPGSLPAGATELLQEGLVIPPMRLTDEVMTVIAANTRRPDERIADLRAQIACHTLGQRRLSEIAGRMGRRRLLAGMDELYDYGVRRMRAAIRELPDGRHRARDVMEGDGVIDHDIRIAVEVTVAGERLVVDFAGTAPQQPGNVNCPLAVTRAAVAYAVRVVCDPDLPASGGALEPVEIRAEPGCLVNAQAPAAVVAGNVETSSRIVDVMLAALTRRDPVAQGQGTMNNVSFGNDRFVYFETVAGGQGASARGDGPDAVHVAMSNTLNTPIEVLEQEYPLRVERYGLRRGTGGEGRHRGGAGVVRAYRVLEDCSASLMAERRRHPPAGAAGGAPGAVGENRLNGKRIGSKVSLELAAGDVVEVRTPGGGGWGKPRT